MGFKHKLVFGYRKRGLITFDFFVEPSKLITISWLAPKFLALPKPVS